MFLPRRVSRSLIVIVLSPIRIPEICSAVVVSTAVSGSTISSERSVTHVVVVSITVAVIAVSMAMAMGRTQMKIFSLLLGGSLSSFYPRFGFWLSLLAV